MTMDEIRASDKTFLIPREIAPVLGCDRYVINLKARDGTLPFNYILCGTRVRVPREGFIAWMEGRTPNKTSGPEEN